MRAVLIFVLLTVPLGDAVTSFPDYPTKPAKECAVTVERDGIRVGLDPVEDSAAQSNLFGVSLTKKGFVPIYLVIENARDADSLIFDTSRISYGSANSEVPAVKTGSITGKMLAASAIPFAGGFIAAHEASGFLRIEHNLLEKEMRSTTISPGLAAHGFLYLPIPKESSRQKITLNVPVGKSAADDVVDLTLTF